MERFDFSALGLVNPDYFSAPAGEWVRFKDAQAELDRTEKHYEDRLAAGGDEIQQSITAHEEKRALALEAGREDLAAQYLAAIDAFREALDAFGVAGR